MKNSDTHQDQSKLHEEILFLKSTIKHLTTSNKENISINWRKGISIAAVAAFITLIAGGFTLFKDVSGFFKEKKKAYDVTYSTQMLELLNKSKVQDKQEREQAIILLSSYEMDALPILLIAMEEANPKDQVVYIRSLSLIQRNSKIKNKVFIQKIIESTTSYVETWKGKGILLDEKHQKNKIYGVVNYIVVLTEFAGKQTIIVKDHLNWFKSMYNTDDFTEKEQNYLNTKMNEALNNLKS